MTEQLTDQRRRAMDSLILQALIRKLVAKGVLSPDEVKALLVKLQPMLILWVANRHLRLLVSWSRKIWCRNFSRSERHLPARQ